MFILIFAVSKELANYTSQKEVSSKFLLFICLGRNSLPLTSVILIVIDYILLFMMVAFNVISLFFSPNCALVLVLICNGAFLAFAGIAGGISHRTKKRYYNSN